MTTDTEQAKLLKDARDQLKITNVELAARLGIGEGTLLNWLLPEGSARHRKMPQTARLLLGYILKEGRKGRRK